MAGDEGSVRGQRSPHPPTLGTVAVTGAAGELGERVVRRLLEAGECKKVIGIDTARSGPGRPDVPGVTWRRADVRDPALRSRFTGVDTVVHLATDRRPDAPVAERRTVNVRGTDTVLTAAAAAGVTRVVLVTSAMVYGASATNPVPLPDDAPIRAEPDLSLVGDWVEMERLAAVTARAHPSVEVVVVRPASVVGAAADALLPRLFEAPRLLAIKDVEAHWQFCHVDDLVSALVWAALRRVDGGVTVGCAGWLRQEDVERVSGLRSLVVPASMAFGTAERLHRIGVLPAPASELHYLAHPWVVGADRLTAAGWTPGWDNEAALRAHLDALGDRAGRGLPRLERKDATRAAAGATVALVGTVAIARARAARRRRRG
jgi:nucleoside-diphosphate-sugar epimerase